MNMKNIKPFVTFFWGALFAYFADYFWVVDGSMIVMGIFLVITFIFMLVYLLICLFEFIDNLE